VRLLSDIGRGLRGAPRLEINGIARGDVR
jgi:hypothetical protein